MEGGGERERDEGARHLPINLSKKPGILASGVESWPESNLGGLGSALCSILE